MSSYQIFCLNFTNTSTTPFFCPFTHYLLLDESVCLKFAIVQIPFRQSSFFVIVLLSLSVYYSIFWFNTWSSYGVLCLQLCTNAAVDETEGDTASHLIVWKLPCSVDASPHKTTTFTTDRPSISPSQEDL